MRSIQWCALALSAAEAVRGYVDTSPFALFSTSEILNSARTLSSAEAITSEIDSSLSLCPTDHYIIVSQPGVSVRDFTSRKSNSFWSKLSSTDATRVRSTVSVPEVVGKIDTSKWEQTLQDRCGAEVKHVVGWTKWLPYDQPMPKVVTVSFEAPADEDWNLDLAENDKFLAELMRPLLSGNYTLLYTTTPVSTTEERPAQYSAGNDQEPLHMGLKRDFGSGLQRRANNQTIIDGPLFEKYQFFTPGIFMGFLVGFILLMILYVGISALNSLQVTYAAFDKEQGALAKTKAQ